MPLSEKALAVVTRPLPKDKIKKRPGKAGMEFSYITPDFVIDTLNEAFDHSWDTDIVHRDIYNDSVVVVGLRLTVPDAEGGTIHKEQFGSCEITRGLGVGEAFKGAASDAMKKCATLLGLGLELYQDDEVVLSGAPPNFTPPKAAVRSAPVAGPPPAPRPPVPTPPRAPVTTSAPSTPRAPAVPVPRKSNPFAGNPPPAAATVPPKATASTVVRTPSPPRPPSAAKPNPFATAVGQTMGPNTTQVNALVALAQRRDLDQAGLIRLAGVVDAVGNPIQTFEDLTREQAIQVIRAAQQ